MSSTQQNIAQAEFEYQKKQSLVWKPPWKMKPLDKWVIVGMNHHHLNGERFLFVSMAKDGRSITEEGKDDEYLWNRLLQKASEVK